MKKIFLLFIVLIIFIFILIFYLIDKVYINKYIKNLQEKLNINIILKEPHQLTIAPNISLLTKFNFASIPKWATVDPYTLNGSKPHLVTNLLDGKVVTYPKTVPVVDPING